MELTRFKLKIIQQFSLLEIDNNRLNYFNDVTKCIKYNMYYYRVM